MTIDDRLHRLPRVPAQTAALLPQSTLRERLQEATARHAEAEATYQMVMAEMASELGRALSHRYRRTITVSAGGTPGWLKLGFFPPLQHPNHTPLPLYFVAERHGLHLAPTPSEQPHEYRIFRTTDWLLTAECLNGIGPVTVLLDARTVEEALLLDVLDRYYQLPRRNP